MAKEIFGASQIALVSSAITLAGQAGWTQRDWEAIQNLEFWERMKLVIGGKAEIIPLVVKTKREPSPKQKIISFYAKVFGLGKEATAALKGQNLKGDENLPELSSSLLILGDNTLTLEGAIQKIAAFWPNESAPYEYGDVKNITIPKGHVRPKGDYMLHHTGEVNSDKAHKGKSYKDSLGIMKFMTPKEYVLFWAYTLWSQDKYLDQSGWTRLCAAWPYGDIVGGGSGSRQLYLGRGYRDNRYSDDGPREVSFVSITRT